MEFWRVCSTPDQSTGCGRWPRGERREEGGKDEKERMRRGGREEEDEKEREREREREKMGYILESMSWSEKGSEVVGSAAKSVAIVQKSTENHMGMEGSE